MAKKRTSLGCLFWIALILLVLVIVLFNRKTIEDVLKSTDFLSVLKREQPRDSNEEEPEIIREPLAEEDKQGTDQEQPEKDDRLVLTLPEEEPEEKIETSIEENKKLRKSNIYFVEVSEDGEIKLRKFQRSIYYTDSPLTDTINILLQGLTSSEIEQEYLTLIPTDTKLISAKVQDKIAYLNFNEAFRFNSFGVEGSIAQLQQIVFTATEFPTVDKVQFLIDGKKLEYLGPEGVPIGKPLGRDSF